MNKYENKNNVWFKWWWSKSWWIQDDDSWLTISQDQWMHTLERQIDGCMDWWMCEWMNWMEWSMDPRMESWTERWWKMNRWRALKSLAKQFQVGTCRVLNSLNHRPFGAPWKIQQWSTDIYWLHLTTANIVGLVPQLYNHVITPTRVHKLIQVTQFRVEHVSRSETSWGFGLPVNH